MKVFKKVLRGLLAALVLNLLLICCRDDIKDEKEYMLWSNSYVEPQKPNDGDYAKILRIDYMDWAPKALFLLQKEGYYDSYYSLILKFKDITGIVHTKKFKVRPGSILKEHESTLPWLPLQRRKITKGTYVVHQTWCVGILLHDYEELRKD